jgi:hypoxanthine phosphoribosyltransferase
MSQSPHAAVDVLLSRSALAKRIGELGTLVAGGYRERSGAPLLIGVLKGSSLFLADLARAVPTDVTIDFMSISSYADRRKQSGAVRIVKDLDQDIAGRDVLVVEDIVDTGLTLNYLRKTLLDRRPRSLKTIVLLNKVARRIVPVPVDFSGFEIPDLYVVGYGMDFQGRYRNLRDILVVRDFARLANDPLFIANATFADPESPVGC